MLLTIINHSKNNETKQFFHPYGDELNLAMLVIRRLGWQHDSVSFTWKDDILAELKAPIIF